MLQHQSQWAHCRRSLRLHKQKLVYLGEMSGVVRQN